MADLPDVPPWVNVLLALGVPAAIWRFVEARRERDKARDDRRNTADERHEASLARERDQLAAANSAVIATLRLELDRERAARERAEAERDLEWNRGRRVYDYARHLVHEARNARQIAESLARRGGEEPLIWAAPIDLPPFDQPPNP
jgi:hypothetical protein